MDKEPNTDSWVISQGITLLRDAIPAEGQSRRDKFGLVIAICNLMENPLTGEKIDHTVPEKLLVNVLKSRALYFSGERSEEAEMLFMKLGEEADKTLEVIKSSSDTLSSLYVRAVVEAKLGQITLQAEKGELSYEGERDCLRLLQKLVRRDKDMGRFIYQELLAKLLWNEANTHCEAGSETVKYAVDPIKELIRLHNSLLIYSLIKKDKIVSSSLADTDIAGLFNIDKKSAA